MTTALNSPEFDEFDPLDGRCDQCVQFDAVKATPYGYCRAAPSISLRAVLRQGNEICHFPRRFNNQQSGGKGEL